MNRIVSHKNTALTSQDLGSELMVYGAQADEVHILSDTAKVCGRA